MAVLCCEKQFQQQWIAWQGRSWLAIDRRRRISENNDRVHAPTQSSSGEEPSIFNGTIAPPNFFKFFFLDWPLVLLSFLEDFFFCWCMCVVGWCVGSDGLALGAGSWESVSNKVAAWGGGGSWRRDDAGRRDANLFCRIMRDRVGRNVSKLFLFCLGLALKAGGLSRRASNTSSR